jgi:small subunit ribosomal protein S6
MREYELTAVYDLAVAEAGGAEASVQHLTNVIESRGGKVLKVDHWGRRRMAYPINRMIDGDYIVTRLELDPAGVNALDATLRIDEKVFRHLVVRADELPVPPPPREPRQMPIAAPVDAESPTPSDAAPAATAAAAVPEAVVDEAAAAVPEPTAPSPEEPPAAVVEATAEAAGEAEATPTGEAPVAEADPDPPAAAEPVADTESTPA